MVSPNKLAKLPDSQALAEMAKRIFSAGFVWRVIEAKWPGFEEAFLGFEPEKLNFRPDEFWEGLARDKRIVRNPQKIKAIRHNAAFVVERFFKVGDRINADGIRTEQAKGAFLLLERDRVAIGTVYVELRGDSGRLAKR